jgi:hypothetical protein
VQKHSETALDTPKNDGTKSSFPVKVYAIPGKNSSDLKSLRGAAVVQKDS